MNPPSLFPILDLCFFLLMVYHYFSIPSPLQFDFLCVLFLRLLLGPQSLGLSSISSVFRFTLVCVIYILRVPTESMRAIQD
jgi:hypothetical protein